MKTIPTLEEFRAQFPQNKSTRIALDRAREKARLKP